jgi:hypothetical protein
MRSEYICPHFVLTHFEEENYYSPKDISINAKLQIGKGGKKIELTGASPLRRRRFALDRNVM